MGLTQREAVLLFAMAGFVFGGIIGGALSAALTPTEVKYRPYPCEQASLMVNENGTRTAVMVRECGGEASPIMQELFNITRDASAGSP